MGNLQSFVSRFGAGDGSGPEDEGLAQLMPSDGIASFTSKFGGLTESYKFYNGEIEIRFDKEEHVYYLVNTELGNLTEINNVSTVAGIVDKSHILVPWSAKMVAEKLLRIIPTELTVPSTEGQTAEIFVPKMTLAAFTELVMQAKTAPRDKLEDAGDVGHMAHDWLEHYIKAILAGDTATQQGMISTMCKDERATNCVIAALDWMKAHNVRWISTETKLYSRLYQCAGTMDGLGTVDSCSDPLCCAVAFKDRLSIIDWKSSNHLRLEYLFQTAAYEGFHEEEYGSAIVDRWVNRLGKEDGEFEAWHLEAEDFKEDYDGFLACLALKKLVDSVEERMKTKKMSIKSAKKAAKVAAQEIAKAAAKADKAKQKAEEKAKKAEEKARIKAEAKANREAEKAVKKAAVDVTVAVANAELSKAEAHSAEVTPVFVSQTPVEITGTPFRVPYAIPEEG